MRRLQSGQTTCKSLPSIFGHVELCVVFFFFFRDASSLDVISAWYITRATEIEEFSGQVEKRLRINCSCSKRQLIKMSCLMLGRVKKLLPYLPCFPWIEVIFEPVCVYFYIGRLCSAAD